MESYSVCFVITVGIMSDVSDSSQDIGTSVRRIAEKWGIANYSFTVGENGNGKSALGTLYFVSLSDATGEKVLKFVIKKAPADPLQIASNVINKTYQNEKYFYDELLPIFEDLQDTFLKQRIFSAVPECYLTIVSGQEAPEIILEDLTDKDYYVLEKHFFFGKDHLELVLKQYGKFHALSFFFKYKFPNKFDEYTEKFTNVFSEMKDMNIFTDSLQLIFNQCYNLFSNDADEVLRNALETYSQNGVSTYFKSLEYSGNNSVFLHGDCWSNNIMFKYNVSI